MKNRLFGAVLALPLAGYLFCGAAAQAAPILWVDDSSGRIGTVDVASGTVTPIGSSGQSLTDIAFSPSQVLYGITFGNLFTINQSTGAATQVGGGSFPTSLNGLVFGSNGTLYGSGGTGLYSINTTTGVATLIGNSGLSGGFGSAGDLAFHNGVLYEAVTNGSVSDLASVNPATGAATLIGQVTNNSNLFGLAEGSNGVLYGIDNTSMFSINPVTAVGTLAQTYSSGNLGQAFGAASRTEAVPEPASLLLLGTAVLGLGLVRRRRRSVA